MNAVERVHPSRHELEAFVLGRLDALEQAEVERHVAQCNRCCEALRSVGDDTLLERLRAGATLAAAPHSSVVTEAFQSPACTADPAASRRVPEELADHPRYRIVRVLGAGGMGVVYQAEHRLMERLVALKVINRELMDNPMAVQRFRLEVKNAARLNHPAIVTAHDAEQAGDLHFLVMEYVDGVSVAQQVVRRGALRVDHACKFIRQAALGLQHAHEKGMVHRDIKPQNLMLARSGRNVMVKILDFGLARFASEQGLAGDQSAGGLTMTGVTLGTPDYMAPEQISDARQADIRSDIYSLGCTFYFMLAGRPPFAEGSAVDKLVAHIKNDPRPISQIRNDAPPEVVAILERMMAKDRANRFQTPGEVAQALAPFCKSGAASLAEMPPAVAELTVPNEVPRGSEGALGAEVRRVSEGRAGEEPPRAGESGSGPVDLSEIKMEELPELLPPIPVDLSASPLPRGHSSRSVGRRNAVLDFAKSHRTAVALFGAAALVALVGWMLYPVIGAAIASRGEERSRGRRESSSLTAIPAAASSQPEGVSPFDDMSAARYSTEPTSGSFAQPGGPEGSARLLVVIPHENFWYGDYYALTRALDLFALDHAVASSSLAPARPAIDNLPISRNVTPDLLLENASAADYDAVIFCGGVPAEQMEFLVDSGQRAAARRLMSDMLAQGKVVAGICAGNAVLADAGILRGKAAAANQYIPEHVLSQSGAQWDWQTMVAVSDRILTGRDASSAKQLMTAIYDRLPLSER